MKEVRFSSVSGNVVMAAGGQGDYEGGDLLFTAPTPTVGRNYTSWIDWLAVCPKRIKLFLLPLWILLFVFSGQVLPSYDILAGLIDEVLVCFRRAT